MDEKQNQPNWMQVLLDILVKILTLGFYHLEKYKKE